MGNKVPHVTRYEIPGTEKDTEVQVPHVSGSSTARGVRRWWKFAHDTPNASDSANTGRYLGYGVTDELEFYLDRDNAAAFGYGQRSERRDDERCQRLVGHVRFVCCYGLVVWFGDLSRRGNSHNHSDVRLSERYSFCDCGDPRSS